MSFPGSQTANLNTMTAQVHPPPNNQTVQTSAESKSFEQIAAKQWNGADAKEAMLKECRNHMTWKKSAVESMSVSNIQSSHVYFYAMETIYESRSTRGANEPFGSRQTGMGNNMMMSNSMGMGMGMGMPNTMGMGMATTMPMGNTMPMTNNSGPTLQPWEVPCEPTQLFKDETKTIEMPNTARITMCLLCNGRLGKQCFSCRGNSYNDCTMCGGSGSASRQGPHRPNYTCINAPPAFGQITHMRTLVMGPDQCIHCRGTGAKQCFHCKGVGWEFCISCNGSGQTKSFVQLTVVYKVERNEILTDCGEIPSEKVKKSGGVQMLFEQKPLITAMNNHPVATLNAASMQFLTQQNAKSTDRRILQQRQVITAIPIATVTYTMSGSDPRVFHMYGEEKNAIVKEFPSKSCAIL